MLEKKGYQNSCKFTKNRRNALLMKLSQSKVSADKKMLYEKFKEKETALLRRKRRKLKVEDYEVLDMIGKGGFGKVRKEFQSTQRYRSIFVRTVLQKKFWF
jgi:hypothetical protein